MNGANGANGHANGHALAEYKRYEITDSGISPRAIPGTEGYVHVVATDEHDEDGVLISDEFTNPHKRQAMHEKRMRKILARGQHFEREELDAAAAARRRTAERSSRTL